MTATTQELVSLDKFDYDLGNNIPNIFDRNKKIEITDNMIDYLTGTIENCSSIKFEKIKSIEEQDKKINEMANYLREDIIKWDFPNEVYLWMARDVLQLQYKKYEIDDMKRAVSYTHLTLPTNREV